MTDNRGRGPVPRSQYKYWQIILVAAIVAGAGVVLYFSIPIFFSPGSGIGEPINPEAELTLILQHMFLAPFYNH